MGPIVYVDILFLLNFFANSIILYISSLLTKKDIKIRRMILSSVFLSLYACLMFFPEVNFIYSILGKIAVLSVASIICYGTKGLLKNTVIIFTVTAILGGILFFLIFATNFGATVGSMVANGEFYINTDASALVMAIILAYACIYIISEIKKNVQIQKAQLFDMQISFKDKTTSLKAFLDTGCSLCESQSKSPAIIISPGVAKNLLPELLYNFCIDDKHNFPYEYINVYRPIPYSTIDKKIGILAGIIPDKVQINDTVISDCIVAVSKKELSSNNTFDAIFGTEIFNELNERILAL